MLKYNMENLAALIIKTDIAVKKAVTASLIKENGQDIKKYPSPLSLKVKLLFVLFRGLSSPSDIMHELCINKSNLAALTRQLLNQKLITKKSILTDKRTIALSITPKGASFLENCLASLKAAAQQTFGSGGKDAAEKLESALSILEFL